MMHLDCNWLPLKKVADYMNELVLKVKGGVECDVDASMCRDGPLPSVPPCKLTRCTDNATACGCRAVPCGRCEARPAAPRVCGDVDGAAVHQSQRTHEPVTGYARDGLHGAVTECRRERSHAVRPRWPSSPLIIWKEKGGGGVLLRRGRWQFDEVEGRSQRQRPPKQRTPLGGKLPNKKLTRQLDESAMNNLS